MYDGQMPVEETEYSSGQAGSFTTVRRNALGARGIDRIETVASQGTAVAYPVYDGHGNMVATLAKSGSGYQVGNRRSFGAWGDVRQGATSGDPKGRYCANLGHLDDDESGLTYMRARYYEADSGRFVSEDRKGEGINWYTYCGNDPSFVDPDGNYRIRSQWLYGWGQTLGYLAGIAAIIAASFEASIFKTPAAKLNTITACLTVSILGFSAAMQGTDSPEGVKLLVLALAGSATILRAISTIAGALESTSAAQLLGFAKPAIWATTIHALTIAGALLAFEAD